MPRPGLIVVATIVAVALAAGSARPAGAEPADKARALYMVGEDLYSRGEYARAAHQFEKAYKASGRAQLLLRLADARERAGDYASAAAALDRYMAVTGTRSERARMQELERRARDARIAEDTGASRTPAYALLGASAVTASGAVLFGVLSHRAGNDVDQQCGMLCPEDAQSAIDRERRYALLSDVSTGLTALALGAGLYLLWRDRGESGIETTRVSITPAADGAGVGLSGSF